MRSGLFGFISNNKIKDDQKITRNVILDTLIVSAQERGHNATGIATIDGGKIEYARKTIPGYSFIQSGEYKKLLDQFPPIAIGATTYYQDIPAQPELVLQPIQAGYHQQIIGVHDGIILDKERVYPHLQGQSDAHIFIKTLWSQNNYLDGFKDLKGDLTGLWWDSNTPDSLLLIKSGYSIYFVTVREVKTTFFASSKYSLQAALTATIGGKFNIGSPEEGYVYTISQNADVTKKRANLSTKSYYERFQDDTPFTEVQLIADKLLDRDILAIDKGLLDGCSKCKKDILEDTEFYYNRIKETVRCSSCGETARPKLDWKKYTDDEYREIIQGTNWGTTLFELG